jgi:uncharacterized small protein (DUF1192 family)
MSTTPRSNSLEVVRMGEPTLFDSLARLVPEELQAAYYRVLAHTKTLGPDDEMLRILEAMGILALLTRHVPKDVAHERERFQELLELHRQFADEAQQKMLGYVHELEERIADLPSEIEAGLDPKEIAKLLGESLRQHFLQSGILDTAKALQTASVTMAGAQKQLSSVLRSLTDTDGGIAAQIAHANSRLTHSLEYRIKTLDSLLHEWKSDLLRIWIPMITIAALLLGFFAGLKIQSWQDTPSSQPTVSIQTSTPSNSQSSLPSKPNPNRKPTQKYRKSGLSQ